MGEAISLHTRQYSQSLQIPNYYRYSILICPRVPRLDPGTVYKGLQGYSTCPSDAKCSVIHHRVIRQYHVGRSSVTIVVSTLFVETSCIEHPPWRWINQQAYNNTGNSQKQFTTENLYPHQHVTVFLKTLPSNRLGENVQMLILRP